MKKIILIGLFVFILSSLTACNFNSVSKRYVNDNSSSMSQVKMSDSEFGIKVNQEIIPVTNSIYNLSTETQDLRGGIDNRELQLNNIKTIMSDLDSIRSDISKLEVNTTKEEDKKNIIASIDSITIQLTSYQSVLTNDSSTTADLQVAIDNVLSALDNLKSFTK